MAFHSIPRAGSIVLPMHIPVLLAGLICGWMFGLVAGITGPLLSHLFTQMPPVPIVFIMMIELGVYGLVAGMVIQFIRTNRSSIDLYIALIIAMMAGRIVAGAAMALYFYQGSYIAGSYIDGIYTGGSYTTSYAIGAWITSYFVTSLPGIVIQLAFIPSVVMALERERVIPLRYPVQV